MKGFHANDNERCSRFLSENDYLIICKDTDYLGTGMYFWEHKSRAQWWLKEQKKEVIVCAEIITDNMLDVTDPEIVKMLGNMFSRMDYVIRKKFNNSNISIKAGIKLDTLFETYPKFLGIYTLVRGRRDYPIEEQDFFEGTKLSTKSVDIYSVRSPEIVIKRERVE